MFLGSRHITRGARGGVVHVGRRGGVAHVSDRVGVVHV